MGRKTEPKVLPMLLEALAAEEKPPAPGYLRASWVGGCPVSAAISLAGVEPEIEPKSALNLWMGRAMHAEFQKLLGIRRAEVELVDEERKLMAHPDGTWEEEVLELKTISELALRVKGLRATMPKWEHVLQTHVYMKLLGFKRARICYLVKAGDWMEFVVEWSDEVWGKAEMWMDAARAVEKKGLEAATLADVEEWIEVESIGKGKAPWQCRYCFFRSGCPVYAKEIRPALNALTAE